MKQRFFKDNGLSLVLFFIFFFLFAGHFYSGLRVYGDERKEHGLSAPTAREYWSTGHLWESVAENWESEFLQMAVYVVFTIFLFQRGSSESKNPDRKEKVDEEPARHRNDPHAPGPVRAGGWRMALYSHSLTLALLALFALSFVVHIFAGTSLVNEQRLQHGEPLLSTLEYARSAEFWFESFQNWQSEFLSVALLIVFSIFLRQIGSPESKPVFFPHHTTGRD